MNAGKRLGSGVCTASLTLDWAVQSVDSESNSE